MAANLKGCTDIISIDLDANRLEKALEIGATETVNPKGVDDVVEEIREFTGSVNYALETTGVPAVAEQATDTSRSSGNSASLAHRRLGREPVTT